MPLRSKHFVRKPRVTRGLGPGCSRCRGSEVPAPAVLQLELALDHESPLREGVEQVIFGIADIVDPEADRALLTLLGAGVDHHERRRPEDVAHHIDVVEGRVICL